MSATWEHSHPIPFALTALHVDRLSRPALVTPPAPPVPGLNLSHLPLRTDHPDTTTPSSPPHALVPFHMSGFCDTCEWYSRLSSCNRNTPLIGRGHKKPVFALAECFLWSKILLWCPRRWHLLWCGAAPTVSLQQHAAPPNTTDVRCHPSHESTAACSAAQHHWRSVPPVTRVYSSMQRRPTPLTFGATSHMSLQQHAALPNTAADRMQHCWTPRTSLSPGYCYLSEPVCGYWFLKASNHGYRILRNQVVNIVS